MKTLLIVLLLVSPVYASKIYHVVDRPEWQWDMHFDGRVVLDDDYQLEYFNVWSYALNGWKSKGIYVTGEMYTLDATITEEYVGLIPGQKIYWKDHQGKFSLSQNSENSAGYSFEPPGYHEGSFVSSPKNLGNPLIFATRYINPDFDLDNDVDGADFLKWQLEPSRVGLDMWEQSFGTAQTSLLTAVSVPEPSTYSSCIYCLSVWLYFIRDK